MGGTLFSHSYLDMNRKEIEVKGGGVESSRLKDGPCVPRVGGEEGERLHALLRDVYVLYGQELLTEGGEAVGWGGWVDGWMDRGRGVHG